MNEVFPMKNNDILILVWLVTIWWTRINIVLENWMTASPEYHYLCLSYIRWVPDLKDKLQSIPVLNNR